MGFDGTGFGGTMSLASTGQTGSSNISYNEEPRVQSNSREREDSLRFLAEASFVLNSSLDYQTTLSTLASLVVPRFADWCSVQMVGPDKELHQVAVAHCDPEKEKWAWEIHRRYPFEKTDMRGPAHVVATGQSEITRIITDDRLIAAAKDSAHLEMLREVGLRSYLCVPLRGRRGILGTLTLVTSNESGKVFDQPDLDFAEEVAWRASMAVENAMLYMESQNVSKKKDEFLATLSHELRTPLNVILGHCELLVEQKENFNHDTWNSIETIQRQAKAQTQIISDLLDVSSLITGKTALCWSRFPPIEVLLEVLKSADDEAQQKGITLLLDLVEDTGICLVADRERVHQVMWNLVKNAIKFTPYGGEVRVKLKNDLTHCQIVVADNGHGIDPGFLHHIFEPFSQEDGSLKRIFNGLGLGLFLVKKLCELHGGSVHVKSPGRNRGSIFTVTFPSRANLEPRC